MGGGKHTASHRKERKHDYLFKLTCTLVGQIFRWPLSFLSWDFSCHTNKEHKPHRLALGKSRTSKEEEEKKKRRRKRWRRRKQREKKSERQEQL